MSLMRLPSSIGPGLPSSKGLTGDGGLASMVAPSHDWQVRADYGWEDSEPCNMDIFARLLGCSSQNESWLPQGVSDPGKPGKATCLLCPGLENHRSSLLPLLLVESELLVQPSLKRRRIRLCFLKTMSKFTFLQSLASSVFYDSDSQTLA